MEESAFDCVLLSLICSKDVSVPVRHIPFLEEGKVLPKEPTPTAPGGFSGAQSSRNLQIPSKFSKKKK